MSDQNTTVAAVPNSSRPARIAETLILGALGVIVLWITATTEHTNGLLLDLKNQSPEIVRASLICGSVALVGFLLSIILTVFGRTAMASILLAVTLTGYGFSLNGSGYIKELRQAERDTERTETQNNTVDPLVTLNVRGIYSTGVDMWVNGVHMGKTPVTMRLSEWLEKTPDWEELPEEQLTEDARERAKKRKPHVSNHVYDKRWSRFDWPTAPRFWNMNYLPSLSEKLQSRKGKSFFTRVSYEGLDGISGGAGGHGNGEQYFINLGFQLKNYEAKIERLLDQARLADYQVTEPWFEAIEAFEHDGWDRFHKAMVVEPDMKRVFDAWTEWKYGLAGVHGHTEAMSHLRAIAEQADEENYYDTSSLAGRAVEILTPQVDARRLTDMAVELIRSTTGVAWSKFTAAEKTYWIVRQNPDSHGNSLTLGPRDRGTSGSSFSWGGKGELLQPPGAVIAHAMAVYLEHVVPESLQVADPDSLQVSDIRDQLSQALLQRGAHSAGSYSLRFAAKLGGPMLEEYLVKKAQRVRWDDIGKSHQDRAPGIHSLDVNKWWYLAANLDSYRGRRFRADYSSPHRGHLLEMADGITEHIHSTYEIEQKLGFLFMDNDLGEESLARQYWPQFKRTIGTSAPHRSAVNQHESASVETDITLPSHGSTMYGHDVLAKRLSYLIAAEPAFDASEYVDIWLDEPTNESPYLALRALRSLPMTKRVEVLDALRKMQDMDERQLPEWAIPAPGRGFYIDLDSARHEIDDKATAEYHLKRLRADGPDSYRGKYVWPPFQRRLNEHVAERPVLIQALVQAEETDIRLLGIRAISEHPTQANRELLETLDDNGDETIKQAIAAIKESWAKLEVSSP